MFDPWPEEPPDPFTDPEDGRAGESRATPSRKLLVAFWGLVVVFNVALFATSLGAMLVAFRGDWELGGRLFFAGLVFFGYGIYKYRRYRERDDLWK